MKITCSICPHHCSLEKNQTGFCRARKNTGTQIECINYGHITALALDPIEKKPLYRFHPGSSILSAGSFGCNLTCPFCQNHNISMTDAQTAGFTQMTPAALAEEALKAVPMGNIGLAFTYNEPFISYEFIRDCAKLNRQNGLKNVLITNGYVCEEPLHELLPLIDAMNIDLKGFTEDFYHNISGSLNTVKNTIVKSYPHCHIELTTLVIPSENDSPDEIQSMAKWIAAVDPRIPLHLTRFFPRFRYEDRDATDVAHLRRLAETAREYLQYVYLGNC